MGDVYLVLVIHSHQPVGNFDHVFHEACDKAYFPFLQTIEKHAFLRLSLHYSGCLLEWMEHNRPDFFDRLARLCGEGRVELIGGGFYEPILTMIPDRDKVGQIKMMQNYLKEKFGQKPRGAWVPERVWEQALTTPLSRAGVEYIVLDDFHFKNAGIMEDELVGYFITEDEGRLLRVFASSEKLRYYIPFQEPERTIEYLREIGDTVENAIIVYGDDGEKFGIWPETYRHVYENGWLERFFAALRENADWLHLITLAEAVNEFEEVGKIYLPDASYREMTEWALPLRAQMNYEEAVASLEEAGLYERVRPFMRGGFWRNFKVKYPESNLMYGRMMRVSHKLSRLNKKHRAYADAQRELYRGQCNCAYWHGVFGGLYLPHLRHGVYSHLIEAEKIIDSAQHKSSGWVEASEVDLDFDGRKEIELSNEQILLTLKPDSYGAMIELHLRSIGRNLLSTLSRKREGYHANLTRCDDADGQVRSIHHITACKQPNLDKELYYDSHPRYSLIDFLFAGGVSAQALYRGEGETALINRSYDYSIAREGNSVSVRMCGRSERNLFVAKAVRLAAKSHRILIDYTILNEGDEIVEGEFAIELNFALLSAEGEARFIHDGNGKKIAEIDALNDLHGLSKLGLVDRDLGIDVRLGFSPAAGICSFPIKTVSQSESGFELVYQSSAVIPHWRLQLAPGEEWRGKIGIDFG